jgi:predicted TPR repeat methyltransferase
MRRETQATAIYDNGNYLEHNKAWHMEDSPYKVSMVNSLIQENNLQFSTCADIGCGAGLVTELLAESHADRRFIGYELSSDAKNFWGQRKDLSNLSYLNQSLLDSDDSFDLVVCLDVFEHVEDCYGFLRSLRAKGRSFIFNIPLDMCVMKLITPGIKYAREEFGHIHYFNEYTAIKTLEDCGFSVIDTKLSAAYLSVPPRNIRQWFALPFRLLSTLFGKSFVSKMFGGTSLYVYARAN